MITAQLWVSGFGHRGVCWIPDGASPIRDGDVDGAGMAM